MLRSDRLKKIGKLKFFIITALLLSSQVSFAKDVHFSAMVDRNRITKDDTVTLTLELSSDGNLDADQEPRLPQLDGWQLLDKWTQSESSSIYDGTFKFIRKFVYHYTLTPKKMGSIDIGSASMRVEGKTYQTAPIKITVVAGGSQVPQRAQPQDEDQANNPAGPQGMPQGMDDDDDDLFTQLLKR
jgi:hypothetical protein